MQRLGIVRVSACLINQRIEADNLLEAHSSRGLCSLQRRTECSRQLWAAVRSHAAYLRYQAERGQ